MNQKERKKLVKKLDIMWSELVKKRAGNKCEYCGKSEYINSHHIFSRSSRSVRWDVDNGVCLCAGHHVFSSTFSAHKTGMEFAAWIIERRGDGWYNKLRLKAHTASKPDFEELYKTLKVELDKND